MATNWAKLIGGSLVGILVAGLIVFLVESMGHSIFPPPQGIDVTDPADLARLMDVMPVGAQAIVLLGWFAGSYVGGWVGYMLWRQRPTPWVVSAFIVAGALFSFATIPHPWWMIVGGIALPLLAALLVVRRTRGDSAPS